MTNRDVFRLLNAYTVRRRRYLTDHGMPELLGPDCCVCRRSLTADGTCVTPGCPAGGVT